ncbi:hypothetical protein [Methylobacterium frigidaeris]|uniref:Uncharacterized protein n=1 Tax=Methylobacterium frigidaeris TaxID=2038277 RepID=A0AA37HGR4_9HYPH|nr:hypothetical protein [Methylobacterium frigidaeris]GJD65772.1 hypothetical protein MPEAHAMD_5967 [Methylobacterium frigidaeris]
MTTHPLLAGLEGLTGSELAARFAEARHAAHAAGAEAEADAATRALHTAMRHAIAAMVRGIEARAATPPAPTNPVPPPTPLPRMAIPPRVPPRPSTAPPAPTTPAPASRLGALKRPTAEAPEQPEPAAAAPAPRRQPPPPPVSRKAPIDGLSPEGRAATRTALARGSRGMHGPHRPPPPIDPEDANIPW